jgi:DNA mismatch repair protein MutH
MNNINEIIALLEKNLILLKYLVNNINKQKLPLLSNKKQKIDDIYEKILPYVGVEFDIPITKNKGIVGTVLETYLGISVSSDCLDCEDGELKTFPVKKLKNGKFVPKETMAITMVSKSKPTIITTEFYDSISYMKMKKMLVVPYYRKNKHNTVIFITPYMVDSTNIKYAEFYKIIENDYNIIREIFIKTNEFHSKNGSYMQVRTKGKGGNTPKTYAFYLKAAVLKKYISLN